jgi:RNA polymerase sigma factor (sigma-70 family)
LIGMGKIINPAFGQKVAEFRRRRGLSQPELASLSGVPLGSVRELEQGRREPLFSTLLALAKALGVRLEAFPSPVDAMGPKQMERRTNSGQRELVDHACERIHQILQTFPGLEPCNMEQAAEILKWRFRGSPPLPSPHFWRVAAAVIRMAMIVQASFPVLRAKLQPGGHRRAEELEEWMRLHKLVETLPEEDREVFELLWYGGLTAENAASVLGVSLRTVRRRWQSAQAALPKELRKEVPTSNTDLDID